MVLPFSREEVQKHLEELGYKNITGHQLDAFIRDLRKLIRYEEKQRRIHEQLDVVDQREKVQHTTRRPRERKKSGSTSTSSAYSSSSSLGREVDMVEVRGRDRQRRRKVVEYGRRASVHPAEVSSNSEENDASAASTSGSEVLLRIHVPGEVGRSQSVASVEQRARSTRFSSKPTTSFIRPPSQDRKAKDLRCDPVRLHEFYKRFWDKTKFPGDNSNKQIRWTVREWMMGEKK